MRSCMASPRLPSRTPLRMIILARYYGMKELLEAVAYARAKAHRSSRRQAVGRDPARFLTVARNAPGRVTQAFDAQQRLPALVH